MRNLDKKKVIAIFVLSGMVGLGMIIHNTLQYSRASVELEQLNNELNLAREKNQQLKKEIENLHEKIEKFMEEESAGDIDNELKRRTKD